MRELRIAGHHITDFHLILLQYVECREGQGGGVAHNSHIGNAAATAMGWCQNMADIQVRRLPVVNRDKRLVGIVSLSDLARKEPEAAKALHGIARPSSQHDQSHTAA
ncbi:MAG: CBS domain-containing protein [Alphaproteobacteria bacterium]|nr:CBS domain-containing protein [Alphaproteobacteria bacterium]MBV8337903.1 CBS domain-containing protein [Alphaproteobacteria bacterium]